MLTEHFSESEFACRCCGQLPVTGISMALLLGLERLRLRIGRPINISSGYRCPDHNRAVGGVWNSQHVKGTAADIYVDGMDVRELANICKQIFDGVGTYVDGGFVHVDMREGGAVPGYFTWEG